MKQKHKVNCSNQCFRERFEVANGPLTRLEMLTKDTRNAWFPVGGTKNTAQNRFGDFRQSGWNIFEPLSASCI